MKHFSEIKNFEEMINEVICGDALDILKTMPNESINSVITSPPYYGLRNYNIDGQIGLERKYQNYIKKLIDIFNEVKRVLKKDGTCFVNLGDSYKGKGETRHLNYSDKKWKVARKIDFIEPCALPQGNLQEKSLMLIPHRFAIAMLDNGWWLRNTLVWVKPNAMPESVQDRWKKAHEYIFFFVKSKKYTFNLDAIRTPHKNVSVKRAEYEQGRNALGLNPSSMGKKYLNNKRYMGMPARMVKLNSLGACPPDYLIINTNCSENEGSSEHYATYPTRLINPLILAGSNKGDIICDPFNGSGTTCVAARYLGRKFIGIDLSEKFCQIADDRLRQEVLPI